MLNTVSLFNESNYQRKTVFATEFAYSACVSFLLGLDVNRWCMAAVGVCVTYDVGIGRLSEKSRKNCVSNRCYT